MKQPTQAGATAADSIYKVNALERAIDVLEAFTATRPELRLADVAQITGLHRSTALRMLAILVRRGLVMRHPDTNRYSLGYGLIQMAETAKAGSGLVERCLPEMRRLRDSLNETVLLSVRDAEWRVDLEQLVGLQENRLVVQVGVRKLLYVGAASKLLLASMGDAEIDRYLGHTPLVPRNEHTIVDPGTLKAEIAKIRTRGYAESLGEGHSRGASVAAPITDREGGIVAALSVFLPHYRYGRSLRKSVVEAVLASAITLSDPADRARRAVGR